MKSKLSLVLFLAAAVLFLGSCSGQGTTTCTTNCTTGNANVILTLFDAPPTNVSFLSFSLPISAVTLTPQTGAPVSVYAPATPATYEMTHLQADSSSIGTFQVPSGTYTALSVLVSTASSVFINAGATTVGTCSGFSICNLSSSAPVQITYTFTTPITITDNQNIGLGVEFNLNNAITSQNGITIDFSQPNVVTVVALPRTGQTAGTLDTVQDFAGLVTAVSSSSITVQSGLQGTLTAKINGSVTQLVDPQNQCTVSIANCFALNSIVSMDAQVNLDGSLTATVVDMLDPTPVENEIEGIFYPTSTAGIYGLILADQTVVTANTALASASFGTGFFVALDPLVTYHVDTKNFSISTPAGFAGSSDILVGQRVRARITAATTGSNGINATANHLTLRFSRLTGTVNTVAGSTFTIANLPTYLGTFSLPPQVQTYVPQTIFDGVTSISDPAFVTPANRSVSISALYLNPATSTQPFLATKIRTH